MSKSAKRNRYLKRFKAKNQPVKFSMNRNIKNDIIGIILSLVIIISCFIIRSHM